MGALTCLRHWYRCRACGHSRASDWAELPANLADVCCNSCRSEQISIYEIATGAALHLPRLPRPVLLPRPLMPPVERWQCCHCGGGGLDSHGDTCPHCHGYGHC